LRQFLDALSLQIDDTYESRLQGLIHNVWELRDKYIDALLGITPLESLIAAHAIQPLTPGQLEMTKLLIRAQYERLRMFSSDAWFFYDLDRIEPFNALKYAAHATSLVEQATGEDPSADIMDIIAPAHSQVSGVSGEMAFLGFLKKFENLARNTPFI